MRKSRIRELENFLLREMESVDICIELVRIREFDSTGGRIELYPRPYFSVFSYNLSQSGKECKGVFSLSFSCEVHNSHLIFLSSTLCLS